MQIYEKQIALFIIFLFSPETFIINKNMLCFWQSTGRIML